MTILHVDQHFPPSATVKKRTHTHRRWVLPELVSPHFSDAVPFLSLGLWENLQETMVETLPQRSAFADFFLMVGDPPDFFHFWYRVEVSGRKPASQPNERAKIYWWANASKSKLRPFFGHEKWGNWSRSRRIYLWRRGWVKTYDFYETISNHIEPYQTILNHMKPY